MFCLRKQKRYRKAIHFYHLKFIPIKTNFKISLSKFLGDCMDKKPFKTTPYIYTKKCENFVFICLTFFIQYTYEKLQ